jgi:hypothetical protein
MIGGHEEPIIVVAWVTVRLDPAQAAFYRRTHIGSLFRKHKRGGSDAFGDWHQFGHVRPNNDEDLFHSGLPQGFKNMAEDGPLAERQR